MTRCLTIGCMVLTPRIVCYGCRRMWDNARVEVSDTPHHTSQSGSRLPRLSRTDLLSRVR